MMEEGSAPTSSPAAVTYTYGGALLDALANLGVRHVCLSPGSRSAPLAICAAAHPALRTWVHIDERSCAFFALGLALSSRRPVVLICTSGTAAANLYPAVIEARYARVPLIVLTADRPPELRGNGAPQAIDQTHLYGEHVLFFADLQVPEAGEAATRYVRTIAARAVAAATGRPRGPVHLNVPLREPLTPPTGWDYAKALSHPARGADGRMIEVYRSPEGDVEGERPLEARVESARSRDDQGESREGQEAIQTDRGVLLPSDEEVERLALLLMRPHVLIVCGSQDDEGFPAAVAHLAAALECSILADPLSGVRCGGHDRTRVLDCYDAFLRDERAASLHPALVLRFGASPTSKSLTTFLEPVPLQIVVDGEGAWRDPSLRATSVVYADPVPLCERLARRVQESHDGRRETAWLERWRGVNTAARAIIDQVVPSFEDLFEGRVPRELGPLLPAGTTVFVGNSMPVRDLDTFFLSTRHSLRFLANRGANGIDGVVSSALGASAARSPLVLIVGDLSFYHDLGGLMAAARYPLSATIVLVNNDGGGIFSFLPQASLKQGGSDEYFETLFGTPTGLDAAPAITMYGCTHVRVSGWEEFRAAVRTSIGTPGVNVVELRTSREQNVILHRAVWRKVAESAWPS